MNDTEPAAPDSTAVRVALWRALHVEVDPPPHVFEDEVGLKLASPDERLAKPPRHGPAIHETLPRIHRGTRPLRRRPCGGTGRQRREPVCPARSWTRHVCPAEAGCRIADEDIRGRPARYSGMEASATYRARLSESRNGSSFVPVDFEAGADHGGRSYAAAGFDAGQRAVVASLRRQHVPHEDAITEHTAPCGVARARIHVRHDIHTPYRVRGPRSASRFADGGEGRAGKRDAFRQLLHSRGDACTRTRSRLQRGPARVGGRPCTALLLRKNRRPSPSKQFGGDAGSEHVEPEVHNNAEVSMPPALKPLRGSRIQ